LVRLDESGASEPKPPDTETSWAGERKMGLKFSLGWTPFIASSQTCRSDLTTKIPQEKDVTAPLDQESWSKPPILLPFCSSFLA
jgi:hypothetical protein